MCNLPWVSFKVRDGFPNLSGFYWASFTAKGCVCKLRPEQKCGSSCDRPRPSLQSLPCFSSVVALGPVISKKKKKKKNMYNRNSFRSD